MKRIDLPRRKAYVISMWFLDALILGEMPARKTKAGHVPAVCWSIL
jgi:hypothetical protein